MQIPGLYRFLFNIFINLMCLDSDFSAAHSLDSSDLGSVNAVEINGVDIPNSIGLGKFLANYTSEDNAAYDWYLFYTLILFIVILNGCMLQIRFVARRTAPKTKGKERLGLR